ncbi:helix-turn-helix domain-containing protein [Metapseudomonas lalkuanensis]|uniref:Helix-turn-helix domain-containing protein n=1 Tax=Metapseudomonas lalkuanensis TaxID=2604832 RepID=A0A5J6QIE0_9GAMM|nr:XRE family transcriptional regulator [Pseudomonas lalkuanensis]QEY62518.1 helix-turn-helix domain-containing protein [Pseudomonas lalkuanensis]
MERHERIAKAIAASGKKKGEIAAECGVAASAVTQWISGESKSMKPENLYALAEATGYRAEWLAIGKGPERDEDASNVSPAAQPSRYYRYAVISSVVAGGWGEAVQPYEPGAEDRAELTDYKAKGPAFWLEVEGDSMTSPTPPSIPEGHLILVDTGIEAQPGHLVVAKLEGDEKATFKKLVSDAGQMYLKPLNPAYPIIPINGNCRIIGVVKEAKMKL